MGIEIELITKQLFEPVNINQIILWILDNKELIQTVSPVVSAIASIFIAIPAWLAFRKVVVNKVNEEQLNEVVNLSKLLGNEKIISTESEKLSLIGFAKKYKTPSYFIHDAEIKECQYNKLMERITNHINNPITPQNIATHLESFQTNIEGIPAIKETIIIRRESEGRKQISRKQINGKTVYVETVNLVKAIKKWLHDNSVKEVNLPDLD